ncbi:MAG: peptidase U32 [Deltaproteobacteria bacterium HGW-Deltaproteobacteria-8]|jgi:putative protease|nr:MAG: peptidase U32 [Deltaproteobacteria bacterium HGW-Deltaproteobacteria-8]
MAPAGDRASFLAAVAAGADAIYLGLKHFSARMQAKNFGLGELAVLVAFAHERGVRVYVTMNVLLKPEDARAAGGLMERLARMVKPDALIVQDLGLITLARQAGFEGEIHISTLANATHPAALQVAKELGATRVVLPRELDLDEVKLMAGACPEGLGLELFVHGALCHCVSGRCWWSSFFGGKSGLRGRCVQPCRRLYRQGGSKGKPERLFSCQDLSLDVVTKPLLSVPQVTSWKIEGRKKGPHYVYYIVSAYRMLRDNPNDAQARKSAYSLIEQALGRPGTHGRFLPQRPFPPVVPSQETASGFLVAQVKKEPGGSSYIQARMDLLPGDLLRLGCEDDAWHQTLPLRRRVPKGGRLDLPRPQSGHLPPSKAPVFLIDRREPELMRILADLEKELADRPEPPEKEASSFTPRSFAPPTRHLRLDMGVYRALPKVAAKGRAGDTGVWLERSALLDVPRPVTSRVWWWLPPVIWPSEEERYRTLLAEACGRGAKMFVLNAPWQVGLFASREGLRFVGGPFCNLASAETAAQYADLGMEAAFVSPELSGEELMSLPRRSPIPLGIVVGGFWPLGITRILAEEVRLEEPILSPRGEVAWVRKFGSNHWIFPGWELDLSGHRRELEQAGYQTFATMREYWPKFLDQNTRTSVFNWDQGLL